MPQPLPFTVSAVSCRRPWYLRFTLSARGRRGRLVAGWRRRRRLARWRWRRRHAAWGRRRCVRILVDEVVDTSEAGGCCWEAGRRAWGSAHARSTRSCTVHTRGATIGTTISAIARVAARRAWGRGRRLVPRRSASWCTCSWSRAVALAIVAVRLSLVTAVSVPGPRCGTAAARTTRRTVARILVAGTPRGSTTTALRALPRFDISVLVATTGSSLDLGWSGAGAATELLHKLLQQS